MWQYHSIQTPVGKIYLVGESGTLNKIYLPNQQPELIDSHWKKDARAFSEAENQILDYFSGKCRKFSLRYKLGLTEFQQQVLEEVAKIPFGETRSYQQLATRLGNPNAVRAVGAANGKNPLPIVIPCHRVIGASQDLVGYAGGLKLKKFLLEFESSQMSLF